MARQPRSPGLVDLHVGRWLRALRKASGLTREQLASRANLTFQQLQKYEAGQNRMSVGRLAELAAILGVSPADFYLGAEVLQAVLGAQGASGNPELERDICDLLIAYIQIGPEDERRKVLGTVKAASERNVKDRDGAVFQPRAVVGLPPTARAGEAGILVRVLGSAGGRAALGSAIPRQVQASWIKPILHAGGEIGSHPPI